MIKKNLSYLEQILDRRARNNQAAKRSRQKKEAQLSEAFERIQVLENNLLLLKANIINQENIELKRQISDLIEENHDLKQENFILKKRILDLQ